MESEGKRHFTGATELQEWRESKGRIEASCASCITPANDFIFPSRGGETERGKKERRERREGKERKETGRKRDGRTEKIGEEEEEEGERGCNAA